MVIVATFLRCNGNRFPWVKVMDVEDAENEVSVSSIILNSLSSWQSEVLSPEDLAWADSCLVKESDVSENDWIPLKNALLDIISSQAQSFSTDGEDAKTPPYNISSDSSTLELDQQSSTSDAEYLSEPSSTFNLNLLTEAVKSTDGIPDDEKTTLPSFAFLGNPFLPTYNEDLKENETIVSELNLDSFTDETEHLAENIFKVWDLNIPSEEGELVNPLDKVLSENSFQSVPSSLDNSLKWKDMEEGSLDDLIAGIADLSLNKNV